MGACSSGADEGRPSPGQAAAAAQHGQRSFEVGDQVEILPQWADPGDESFTWVVVVAEEKGRVDIAPIDIGLALLPRYVVQVEWIRHSNAPSQGNADA